MKIGYIGLGKMGSNMVLRLLEKGIEVVAWNRSPESLQKVEKEGAEAANSPEDLIKKLSSPRIIWLMLPSGDVIDQMIATLLPSLSPNDLIIDGGNSQYEDTLRREKELSKHNINFLDVGVSGGPGGARKGACLMIGGKKDNLSHLSVLFEAMAAPQAIGYFGKLGSGHFSKMVHNGIEYGMMESIAEGAAVLKRSQFGLDLAEIFRVYNNMSVITSRLVGWTHSALEEDQDLKDIDSKISASGEGKWTYDAAQQLGVDAPAIKSALDVRSESDKVESGSANAFRNKVVSAQRGKFGNHPVKIKGK